MDDEFNREWRNGIIDLSEIKRELGWMKWMCDIYRFIEIFSEIYIENNREESKDGE